MRSSLRNRTVRALDACYKSVVAPERWPEAMQSLVESLGAASGDLLFPDNHWQACPIDRTSGIRRSVAAQPRARSRSARRTKMYAGGVARPVVADRG